MIPRFENLPQYSRGTIFLRDRRGRVDILNLVLEGPRPVVPPGGGRGGDGGPGGGKALVPR